MHDEARYSTAPLEYDRLQHTLLELLLTDTSAGL